MNSVFISVPVADRVAVNAALESAGYGPNNLNVPMRGSTIIEDEAVATNFGTHWWIGDDFESVAEIVRSNSPTARIVAGLAELKPEIIDELDIEISEKSGFDLVDSQAGGTFFVPVNPQLIDGLNRGLYALTNSGKEGRYSRVIEHPSRDPQFWPLLQLRESDIVPISVKANPTLLIQVLSVFVRDGAMTQQELDTTVQAVQLAAGQSILIRNFIPASWQQWILSNNQAAQAGYFSAQTQSQFLRSK